MPSSTTKNQNENIETGEFNPNDYPKLRLKVYKGPQEQQKTQQTSTSTQSSANQGKNFEIKSPLGELSVRSGGKGDQKGGVSEFSIITDGSDTGIKGNVRNGQMRVETYHPNHNYGATGTGTGQHSVYMRGPIVQSVAGLEQR